MTKSAHTSEPEISINGTVLSAGQAMAPRVAVTSFQMELNDDAMLGDDEHGLAMVRAYRERIGEVVRMMVEPRPSTVPTVSPIVPGAWRHI